MQDTSLTLRPNSIRPARDDDGGQLAALIALCWVDYPNCILDIAGEEPVLHAIASAFAAKGGQFWVAHKGQRPDAEWIVGCVGMEPTPGGPADAELKKMYVHPRLRRQGLARQLATLAEDAARTQGAATLDLWSDTRFGEAHAFYSAIGYRRTGEIRSLDDRSNTSEYRFVKLLSAKALSA